jgi:hypothetical protein
MIVNGIQISIQASVDGKHPVTGVPPAPITVRITDDNIYRITDDDEYRIID